MRAWPVLALICLLLPGWAMAAPVAVTTGEHPGFTRLVLQYDSPVNWLVGRTSDGYELRLPENQQKYDLSKVFNAIGKTRLAAIWVDPDSGALHVGVACACYAMPFEFRPGIVVIDLHDGVPPNGSSFEAPLDGQTPALHAPTMPRPRTRPAGPRPVYDWTAQFAVPGAGPPMAKGPATKEGATLAVGLGLSPTLEPLRQSLIEQLSLGASEGIVDMAKPKKQMELTSPETDSVSIHLGDAPNLVVRQKGEGSAPMGAKGQDCIPDDRLNIADWVQNTPVAEQFGPMMSGLTGEFDKPDPEAVRRAVRFDLSLGFGAEARALIRAFPTDDPDTAIWQSMARILDDQTDPMPAFHGMEACDTSAALWAAVADPNFQATDQIQKAAILRGFSALPSHLRRLLGPILVSRMLKVRDFDTASSLRDAAVRGPGDPGPEVMLMQAEMDAAMGAPAAAATKMEQLATTAGPGTPDALVALVEHRVSIGQDVSHDQVGTLEEYLKERRGSADEMRFKRAFVLAQAASGDFDAAFAGIDQIPDAEALLWQILARSGSDSALLTHATLADQATPPDAAGPIAGLIADRMLQLGFADQAARWAGIDVKIPALLRARIALALGDAQGALDRLGSDSSPAGLRTKVDALRMLGDETAVAGVYAATGNADEQWRALGRAGNWPKLAAEGPAAWKTVAEVIGPPVQPNADPMSAMAAADANGQKAAQIAAGPIAKDKALVADSAATRDAITALLDQVKSPVVPTQ